MARTVVCFLREDHNLKRLPRKLLERLHGGTQALPRYAGTTQKLVEVFVEYKRKEPQRIIRAGGWYYTFDANGHLADNKVDGHRPQWELSEEDLANVLAQIWGHRRRPV
jgi:hypothetical protein